MFEISSFSTELISTAGYGFLVALSAFEAGDLIALAGEADTDGGVTGDSAAKQVTNEGFDGIRFVEGQMAPPVSSLRTLARIA